MTARVSVSIRPRSCSAISTSDMLIPVRSSRFKRDVKKAWARGKDLSKLRVLLESPLVTDSRWRSAEQKLQVLQASGPAAARSFGVFRSRESLMGDDDPRRLTLG